MRILRHGLEVTEMAVSELPANPNAVWTVKKTAAGVWLGEVGVGGAGRVRWEWDGWGLGGYG